MISANDLLFKYFTLCGINRNQPISDFPACLKTNAQISLVSRLSLKLWTPLCEVTLFHPSGDLGPLGPWESLHEMGLYRFFDVIK